MNKAHLIMSAALLASAPLLLGLGPEKPTPAKIVKGVQIITITVAEGKYTPSVISAVKGKPLAITFKGGKRMGCGSEIAFASLKMKKTVKEGQSVVFKFTPKKAGNIEFACSMHMYVGKVVVK
jgi:plastocyanin domain-containing protein